jgi:hypothetical protein
MNVAVDGAEPTPADAVVGAVDPNTNEGAAVEGSPVAPVNPFAELAEPADREWVEKWHKNDPASLVKAARESDRIASGSLQVPKADADQETWDKFYTKLGRPETAEGYTFNAPKEMPENMPYDGDAATWLKGVAHKLGLSASQAAGLHDDYVEFQSGRAGDLAGASQQALGERVAESISTMTEKWGPMDGGTFKMNVELADRFFKAVDVSGDLKGELNSAGLIGENGEILSASLAFAFANAGAAIYAEGDAFNFNDGQTLEGNPFEKDNLTAIMALVKADPDKARDLARAAGKPLAQYGL